MARADAEQQKLIIEGDGKFPGVHGFFNHLERKKYKLHVRVFLSRYRGYSQCPNCGGARLRPEARAGARSPARTFAKSTAMTVEEAHQFFDALELSRGKGGDRRASAGRDPRAATVSG